MNQIVRNNAFFIRAREFRERIANLFKKNPNYQITIYEKNTSVTLEQGYGVQLSVNSIRILNEIGVQKYENNDGDV